MNNQHGKTATDVCAACGEVRKPDCERAHCALNVVLTPFFGHIRMESRMRQEGNRVIGEGRTWHYDENNVLVKDTGWEPTGVTVIFPEPEPCRRWWEFWK